MKSRTLRPSTWETDIRIKTCVVVIEVRYIRCWTTSVPASSTVLVNHLQDPLIAIVSYPLDHVDPKGVHELIVSFSQNFPSCLCQSQDKIITGIANNSIVKLQHVILDMWLWLKEELTCTSGVEQILDVGSRLGPRLVSIRPLRTIHLCSRSLLPNTGHTSLGGLEPPVHCPGKLFSQQRAVQSG